jgi:hypothetical protein
MENIPSFLITFNVAAATFPRFASGFGLIWAVSRVFYQIGYGTKGPSGRAKGSRFSGIAAVTLVFPSKFVY